MPVQDVLEPIVEDRRTCLSCLVICVMSRGFR